MKEKPPDEARLQHIRDAIEEVESYVEGIDLAFFEKDSKTRFASIKQMEIVGEAVYHLTEELKEKYPEVEWKAIAGLRHILVHDYYEIQNDILWRIIQIHVPVFKQQILEIISEIDD